jgi:hypothetical protein
VDHARTVLRRPGYFIFAIKVEVLALGGLTTKIQAVVDTSGLSARLALTTGEAHESRPLLTLLSEIAARKFAG